MSRHVRNDFMNTITLILDDLDFEAVNNAIEERSRFGVVPDDDGSNAAGACIAEICRGWNEMLHAQKPRPESGEEWREAE